MRCSEARRGLLEADRVDLTGQGTSPLAQHLQLCSRCRSIADFVLQEEDRMGAQMAEAVTTPDLDRLLEDALGPRAKPTDQPPLRPRTSTRLKRVGFSLIPLAAAAALATLFLRPDPSLPGDPYAPPQRTAGLDLEVPGGQNAVVLKTNDPDITVLWFF